MIILIIVLIIIFCIYIWIYTKSKYSKYYISRNSFNNRFNSELIILPECITAFGFDNKNYYIYNQYGIFSDELCSKHIDTFLDYWIKYIHPNISV